MHRILSVALLMVSGAVLAANPLAAQEAPATDGHHAVVAGHHHHHHHHHHHKAAH
jgi:hypothetical protein